MERPLLKVSYKDKIKDDFAYCKQWIDYTTDNVYRRDTDKLEMLYKLSRNVIDQDWFNHVTNPYNAKRKANKQFPAKIEMYNLLYSNFRLLVGEKIGRPFSYVVTNKGSDAGTKKNQAKLEEIKKNLMQHFVNAVNELGGNQIGEESKEVPTAEETSVAFEATYKDAIAILGQDILDHIIQNNRAKEVFIECFKDWLIAGEAYTYAYVRNDEVFIERVSPFDISYAKSKYDDIPKFVEDGDWVSVRYRWSPNQVLDHFHEHLSEEDMEYVSSAANSTHSPYYKVFKDFYTDTEVQHPKAWLNVYHSQWKCFTKKKSLTWQGMYGEETIIVDESYKLTEQDKENNATLEVFWVPEVWEGWKIDDRIYLGIRPLPEQRNSVNDPGHCKLSYNGYRTEVSMFELGLVWQKLYVICWYRLELALAKSKGTLTVLPMQAIPTGEGKEGWDKETFLYTSEALGMILVDLEADGMEGRTLNNMVSKVDMNQFKDVQFFIQLLEYIKTTWDTLIGISNQRKGQIQASQGLGTSEQAITQSNAITELYYYEFEKMEERDISRLLDYSKMAYIDGRNVSFLTEDLREKFIEVDPITHLHSDYGVHVIKSTIEVEKLRKLKEAGVNLASQGNRPSVIAEIIDAASFTKAKGILAKMEQEELKMSQQQQESQAQLEQQQAQIQREYEAYLKQLETQSEIEIDTNRISLETQKELTKIQAEVGLTPEEPVQVDNSEEIENKKITSQERLKAIEMSLKNKEIAANLLAKKIDAESKIAVAKENKNKYDK